MTNSDKEAEELWQEIIDMMKEEQEEIAFSEKWNAEDNHGKAQKKIKKT